MVVGGKILEASIKNRYGEWYVEEGIQQRLCGRCSLSSGNCDVSAYITER